MNPKISIVIPFHWMENWPVFLTRCLASIEAQTFTDYEVILAKHSNMPVTSNRAIESAKGDIIKVLYMDDYLAHGNALQEIFDAFTKDTKWLATGCLHDRGDGNLTDYHSPSYNDAISTGTNSIGSPSVLSMRRHDALLFDPMLSWLLDCDLYKRLHDAYGDPTILDTPNIVIGLGKHQMTHILTQEEKLQEHKYLDEKYA